MTEQEFLNSFPSRPPSFSNEQVEECRRTGDYIPMLFDWYQYVGLLIVDVTSIQKHSPAFRQMPAQHYHVLVGLLHRCARLMLSNVALSHEGLFGETTAIIDRCIFESGIKVIWLCKDPIQENFTRYLADGLKTEIELKGEIESRVKARSGQKLPIEVRMLRSIDNSIAAAELSESDVISAKKLPDLASMVSSAGFSRLSYVVGQRLGSHHVHGTWPSLLSHYLEEKKGVDGVRFVPRDHNCSTHINQFMSVPRIMLQAMSAYLQYAIIDDKHVEAFDNVLRSTHDEIMRIYTEAKGGDLAT